MYESVVDLELWGERREGETTGRRRVRVRRLLGTGLDTSIRPNEVRQTVVEFVSVCEVRRRGSANLLPASITIRSSNIRLPISLPLEIVPLECTESATVPRTYCNRARLSIRQNAPHQRSNQPLRFVHFAREVPRVSFFAIVPMLCRLHHPISTRSRDSKTETRLGK